MKYLSLLSLLVLFTAAYSHAVEADAVEAVNGLEQDEVMISSPDLAAEEMETPQNQRFMRGTNIDSVETETKRDLHYAKGTTYYVAAKGTHVVHATKGAKGAKGAKGNKGHKGHKGYHTHTRTYITVKPHRPRYYYGPSKGYRGYYYGPSKGSGDYYRGYYKGYYGYYGS